MKPSELYKDIRLKQFGYWDDCNEEHKWTLREMDKRGEVLRVLLVEAKQHLAHLDFPTEGAPYYVSRLLEQALRLLPPQSEV